MANEWILDVLEDLKTFAARNGLPAVANGIDDLSVVAAAELASAEGTVPMLARREETDARRVLRTYGSRNDAG